MKFFDRLTGINQESLEDFLRRMFWDMVKPYLYKYGNRDMLDTFNLNELLTTIPATIMNITEQYDIFLKQGKNSSDILDMLNSHRLMVLASTGVKNDLDDKAPTDSLVSFIIYVVKRETKDTLDMKLSVLLSKREICAQDTPALIKAFQINEEYVEHVISEIRAFVQKNPKNTIIATGQRMKNNS
ncbi:MAG: hypothetical protein Q8O92_12225 [Candidatus Latescibacter sp.]|nr:hypothetical protein [Candidatus Latescibacter sp.]